MGIKERREREKKEIKDLILKTVYRLVNDEGWEGVTIRKVADIIEYSPPIIYAHFESKELMLIELQKEAFAKLMIEIRKGTKDLTDPSQGLIAASFLMYDFCEKHLGYAKVMFGLDGVPAEDIREIPQWEEIYNFVREKIAATLDISDVNSEEVKESAELFRATVRGVISNAVIRNGVIFARESAHHLLKAGVENIIIGQKMRTLKV